MMDGIIMFKNAKVDIGIYDDIDAILEEDFYSSPAQSERSIMKSSKKNHCQKKRVAGKGGADEDHVV